MKFSIIMPSFLGKYKGAASNREIKFLRAVDSCLAQSFVDFELIIVADGCEQTFEIVSRNWRDPRINCSLIEKQKLWSGNVRNRGIANAQGEYILYLDTDDKLGPDHLKIVYDGMYKACHQPIEGEFAFGRVLTGKWPDWVFFNDWILKKEKFEERECNLTRFGHNGTSNICHRKDLNLLWLDTGYAHDWHFIKDLRRASVSFKQIATPQYYVCHIPNIYDI